MSNKQYDETRPSIPADIRRTVEVEAGHACSIKACYEHTYLELHHINENREDNRVENLVLLCDRHHKMAHSKVIDRKALKEYKQLLNETYNSNINDRFDKLEQLVKESQQDNQTLLAEPVEDQPANEDVLKLAPSRSEILKFVLVQLGISTLEREMDIYFERQVEFVRGTDKLLLDGLRQDDNLDNDYIIEFQYLRRRYMDAPVYGEWVKSKTELYELLTGRKAIGILLLIVGRENMKSLEALPLTVEGVNNIDDSINIKIYSYDDIGFNPGPVSAALATSNVKLTSSSSEQPSCH